MPTGSTPYDYMYIGMGGGLNAKDSPLVLNDDELQLAQNCTISAKGVIQKRRGFIYDSTHVIAGSDGIENLCLFPAYTSITPVVSSITTTTQIRKLYRYSQRVGYTEITGGTALTRRAVSFCDYHDWLLAYDGNIVQAYNGGSVKYDATFDPGATYSQDQDFYLMAVCDNRIFGVRASDRNMLVWSDYGAWGTSPIASGANKGLRFLLANGLVIPERNNDSKGIVAIKSYGNNDELLIFRENDVWALVGVGTDDYRLMKVRGYAGCVSSKGICEIEDGKLFVVGNGKIHVVDGNSMYPISDKIEPLIKNKNLNKSTAVYDAKNNLVLISYPSGTLVFNLSNSNFNEQPQLSWTNWTFKFNTAAVMNTSSLTNKVYFTVAGDTHMYRQDTYADNGTPFTMSIQSKLFDWNAFAEMKQIRGIKTLQDTTRETPFTVYIMSDDNRVLQSKVMTMHINNKYIWNSGLRKPDVRLATVAALPTCTAAGAGVGKTLTATGLGALSVDGTAVAVGDRVLVKNQVATRDNGVYSVTIKGDGGTAWKLTRATDMDATADFATGRWVKVLAGATISSTRWMVTIPPTVLDNVTTGAMTWAAYSSSVTNGLWNSSGTYYWNGARKTNGSITLEKELVGQEFSVRIDSTDIYPLNLYRVALEYIPRNRRRDKE